MKHFIAFLLIWITAAATARAQNPVESLLKKLDSKKSDTRFDALMALADLGPQAAPATDRLISILKQFDEEDRTLATIVLGKIGKPAISALEKLLDHEDEAVRHNAVWALGLMSSDARANVPRLLKLLERDPDADVRGKAVFALTRIAPADSDTFTALAALAVEKKTPLPLRLVILEEIRHCGEPAVGTLGRALQNERTYEIAQQSLKHLLEKQKTKAAAEAMCPYVETAYAQAIAHPAPPWLRNQNSPIVSDLCDGAGMSFVIATLGEQVLAPVEKRLQSKDAAERASAGELLGKMGRTLRANGDAPELVERIVKTLLPLFHDPDPAPRVAVIESISHTKASVAALRAAFLDEDRHVRRAAYFSLPSGLFEVMGALRARFAEAKGEEKVRVACALASLEYDKDALAFLWKHLGQPKAEFRHRAAYSIGASQPLTAQQSEDVKKLVLPVLVESLKSDDPVKRVQAAEAMSVAFGQLDGQHVPTLLAALKDKDARVRQHVIATLRYQAYHTRDTRKDILPAVQPFLRDPDPQTRIYAIQCFGNTGNAGVADLIKLLETEKHRVVRNQIMTSLQQPGEAAAAEVLFKALNNPDDWNHAIDALWRVGEKKTFPRTLEILRKQDGAVDLTFAEVKVQTPMILDAVQSLFPLFQRDDLAVNRRAVHTLGKLSIIFGDDTKYWMMPMQRAIEQRLQSLKPALEAKDETKRAEAVAFLGELRARLRSMYYHISSRTDAKLRPEMDELFHKNHQTIDDYLSVARRDDVLSIRRAARKAMLTLTPLDPSR